eukprot:gene7397-5209_t
MRRLHLFSLQRFLLAVEVALAVLLCAPGNTELLAHASVNTNKPLETNSEPPLIVLNLFSSDTTEDARLLSNGFSAAVYPFTRPDSTINGRGVYVSSLDFSDDSFINHLKMALEKHPGTIAMVGLASDAKLMEVLAYTKEHAPSLVAVGPYTNQKSSRAWSSRAYFLRADPVTEINAIATDIIHRLSSTRIGIMRLTGANGGDTLHEQLRASLRDIHQVEPTAEYVETEENPLNLNAFRAFSSQRLQAVVILGKPGYHTRDFVHACRTDQAGSMLMSVPLYFTSATSGVLYEVNLPSDTAQNLSRMPPSTPSHSSSGRNFVLHDDPLRSVKMFSGWMIGKILIQALLNSKACESREKLQKWLFRERLFSVSGNIMGVFSGECNALEDHQQALCRCNQGGHTAYVNALTRRATPAADGSLYNAHLVTSFSFPREYCYATQYEPPAFAQGALLQVQRSIVLHDAVASLEPAMTKAAKLCALELRAAIGVKKMRGSSVLSLASYAKDRYVDLLMGPVLELEHLAQEMPQTLIVNPIPSSPQPRVARRNVLYLTPTMDQQIYLWAKIAKERGVGLSVVVPPAHAPEITMIAHDAAEVYGVKMDVAVTPDVKAVERASPNSIVLVIGLDANCDTYLRQLLQRHPQRFIALLYEELSLYFDVLTSLASASPEMQRRLLFLTNLPLWNDYSEASATKFPALAQYHASITDPALINPLSLQAWYSTGVLKKIQTCQYGAASSTLVQCAYHLSGYVFGGVEFGGLACPPSCASYPSNPACRNFAAGSMTSATLERAFNNCSNAPLWGPFSANVPTPRIGYNLNVNILLATLIPVTVSTFVAVVLFLFFCCRRGRNSAGAPQDGSKPVTILFTGVLSSTALWSSFPKEMNEAMTVYDESIRLEINKYDGYEVKTIADSFMIASKCPVKAVELAVSIQKALYRYHWGTECFDNFYFLSDARDEEGVARLMRVANADASEDEMVDEVPFFEHLADKGYKERWNGLRVYIGIHTGLCGITYHKETKSFDYHGDTVDTALRTAAKASGGQVLITKNTLEAVWEQRDPFSLGAITFRDMGPHPLKGLPLPAQMYQVDSIPNREFRTRFCSEEDSGSDFEEEESQVWDPSDPEFRYPVREAMFKMIRGLVCPFAPSVKLKRLKSLMKKWHVSTEVNVPNIRDEKAFRLLLLRFVNRRAHAVAQREHLCEVEKELTAPDDTPLLKQDSSNPYHGDSPSPAAAALTGPSSRNKCGNPLSRIVTNEIPARRRACLSPLDVSDDSDVRDLTGTVEVRRLRPRAIQILDPEDEERASLEQHMLGSPSPNRLHIGSPESILTSGRRTSVSYRVVRLFCTLLPSRLVHFNPLGESEKQNKQTKMNNNSNDVNQWRRYRSRTDTDRRSPFTSLHFHTVTSEHHSTVVLERRYDRVSSAPAVVCSATVTKKGFEGSLFGFLLWNRGKPLFESLVIIEYQKENKQTNITYHSSTVPYDESAWDAGRNYLET